MYFTDIFGNGEQWAETGAQVYFLFFFNLYSILVLVYLFFVSVYFTSIIWRAVGRNRRSGLLYSLSFYLYSILVLVYLFYFNIFILHLYCYSILVLVYLLYIWNDEQWVERVLRFRTRGGGGVRPVWVCIVYCVGARVCVCARGFESTMKLCVFTIAYRPVM